MKYLTFLSAALPAVIAGQWWNGAPECAQSCLSSAWAGPTGTTTSWWPQQSEYCDSKKGNSIGSCIDSACSSTSTAYSSYSSLSASLCSRYASCTSAGSTGVQTITYPGGPVTWAAPGGWGGQGGKFGPGNGYGNGNGNGGNSYGGQWGGPNGSDASKYWSDWSSAYSASATWSGGVVTVTGCAFDGSPWFVGPSCGWNGQGGFNGFVGWGSGWSWGPTSTGTVTVTTTDSAGQTTTETGVGTVAVAISGTLTTSSLVGKIAQETGSSSSGDDQHNAANRLVGAGGEGSIVTVFLGVGLGAVLTVAGML